MDSTAGDDGTRAPHLALKQAEYAALPQATQHDMVSTYST